MADFEHALGEVKPAFGISSEDLAICVRGRMIDYSLAQRELMSSASELVKQMQSSEHTSVSSAGLEVSHPWACTHPALTRSRPVNGQLLSMLLEGDSGSGKTAIAATLALKSNLPFVKLVSPNSLVGVSEVGKASMSERYRGA